ncbi:MAG: AsmA family protein [Alphaproteobacteria bacterium]|nr:AsmA family protein [Alphaproteobacteria bacterium]
MTLHKAIAAAAITLIGLVVAVIIYVQSIDFDRYRTQLVQELRDATGRDVSIGGPIELAFGLDSAFVIRDVRIGNAPWGSRGDMAKIGRVEARFRLLPLLAGEMRIDRLRLIQPDLWLETDPVGKVNWVLAGAPTERPQEREGAPGSRDHILGMLGVAGVDLVGGRVTYRDGGSGAIHVVAFDRVSVAGDGFTNPLSLGVEGSWNGLPLSAQGEIGPFDEFLGGGQTTYPVDATVKIGGVQLKAAGTLGEIVDGPGITLKVEARADTLKGLERVVGPDLAAVRRLSLAGALHYRGQRLTVSKIRFGVGESSMLGDVKIDFATTPPTFSATLDAPTLDLSAIGDTPDSTVAINGNEAKGIARADSEGPFFSLSTWRLPGLTATNGRAQITAQSVRLGAVMLHDVRADLHLKDGALVVEPFVAQIDNSGVEGRLHFDAKPTPAVAALEIRTSAFTPGALLQRLDGVRAFDGTLTATADLRFKGDSMAALLASLEGEVLIAMGPGRISLEAPNNAAIDPSQLGVPGLFGMLVAANRHDAAIVCAAQRIRVRNGVVRSAGAKIESEFAHVTVTGQIDLPAERYALRFVPRTKGQALAVGKPVALGGPLWEPTLQVETQAARGGSGLTSTWRPLRKFFESLQGGGKQNACLKSLPRTATRAKKTPRRPQQAERPVPVAPPAVSAPAAPPAETPVADDLNNTE